jgi:indole-3-glycerol phosphate synthase
VAELSGAPSLLVSADVAAAATPPDENEGAIALRNAGPSFPIPVLWASPIRAVEGLYRSRLWGADAALARGAELSASALVPLLDVASTLHMHLAVEVESEAQLSAASAAGARCVVLAHPGEGAGPGAEAARGLASSVPKHISVLLRGPFRTADAVAAARGWADGVWLSGPLSYVEETQALLPQLVEAADNG